MKFLFIALAFLATSCVQHEPNASAATSPDTTEKHYDCYIIEERMMSPGHWEYSTECGIIFDSDREYGVGDTLKGFSSPKHK